MRKTPLYPNKVPEKLKAKTPEEFAIADKNGHLPITTKSVPLQAIRHIFLYGLDGVIPMSEQQLQEMTGATTAQIKRHYRQLMVERTEMMKELLVVERKSVVKTMLNDDTLQEHKRLVNVLKEQLDEVEFELSCQAVGSKNHANLLKTFLDLKDRWEKDVGVVAIRDATAAIIKEDELENAREVRALTKGSNTAPKSDESKKLRNNSAFDV